jgi:hypothetical protein
MQDGQLLGLYLNHSPKFGKDVRGKAGHLQTQIGHDVREHQLNFPSLNQVVAAPANLKLGQLRLVSEPSRPRRGRIAILFGSRLRSRLQSLDFTIATR